MARAARQLLFLELNEINFEFVRSYAARGELPAFKAFLDAHGFVETTSESDSMALEPWIQWVTAHTGMSYAEHSVFRLGDSVDHDHPQIWERLEALGFSVGAVSPMNATNRVCEAAFFVPDPWTATTVSAPTSMRNLHRAVAQAVNDNASARITPRSALDLVVGGALAADPRNYSHYVGLLRSARAKPWRRAMFLDLLLADVFARAVARTGAQFATLFLNAGAHIQHHYMFSSPCYTGPQRNPAWYVAPGEDPVLDAYRLYDRVLARLQARFPEARIMLATGLHQDPHRELTYYWRLRDHGAFLRHIGIGFASVEPRMSRDFLVRFRDEAAASTAARRLGTATADDGAPLFAVDNRGDALFVELIYPHDIAGDAGVRIGNERFDGLRAAVAFVAIKNGEHNGIGYFADSGAATTQGLALKDLPDRIVAAMTGVGGPSVAAALA